MWRREAGAANENRTAKRLTSGSTHSCCCCRHSSLPCRYDQKGRQLPELHSMCDCRCSSLLCFTVSARSVLAQADAGLCTCHERATTIWWSLIRANSPNLWNGVGAFVEGSLLGYRINRDHCAVSVYCWKVTILPLREWKTWQNCASSLVPPAFMDPP